MQGARQLEVEVAVENLYEVFATYRFRANMPCCIPHCFEQAEIDALGRKTLRALEAEDLNGFVGSLLLTCGETPDLKYFLPRLFELTAFQPMRFIASEIVIGKLHYGAWLTWPESERAAVGRFLMAWWQLELETDGATLEGCLAALCNTDTDPGVYLRVWRDLEPNRHAVSLARFINENLTMILIGRSFNAFVDKTATRAIEAFFREPETRARIEAAFFQTKNRDDLEVLSLAEQLLSY
jgi:hypothetical protein